MFGLGNQMENSAGIFIILLLFSAYAEKMIELIEGIEEGVKVRGELQENVRFTVDQGMEASD